jgi:hypothetical protein
MPCLSLHCLIMVEAWIVNIGCMPAGYLFRAGQVLPSLLQKSLADYAWNLLNRQLCWVFNFFVSSYINIWIVILKPLWLKLVKFSPRIGIQNLLFKHKTCDIEHLGNGCYSHQYLKCIYLWMCTLYSTSFHGRILYCDIPYKIPPHLADLMVWQTYIYHNIMQI